MLNSCEFSYVGVQLRNVKTHASGYSRYSVKRSELVGQRRHVEKKNARSPKIMNRENSVSLSILLVALGTLVLAIHVPGCDGEWPGENCDSERSRCCRRRVGFQGACSTSAAEILPALPQRGQDEVGHSRRSADGGAGGQAASSVEGHPEAGRGRRRCRPRTSRSPRPTSASR